MNEVETEDSGIVTEGGNPLLEPKRHPIRLLLCLSLVFEDMVESYQTLRARLGPRRNIP